MTSPLVSIGCLPAGDTETIGWVTSHPATRVTFAPALTPHTHAGVEELHLLDGELWINGRKLVPGDYNYGEPGALDESVWSETGCTCALITSTGDLLL